MEKLLILGNVLEQGQGVDFTVGLCAGIGAGIAIGIGIGWEGARRKIHRLLESAMKAGNISLADRNGKRINADELYRQFKKNRSV